MEIVKRKMWWLHEDGIVRHAEGVIIRDHGICDGDMWFFDFEYEFEEPIHEDNLFETKELAEEEARNHCEQQIERYTQKLQRLKNTV